MQRVYGTAFFSDKELKAHLTQIEEAKKRDHRKLGRELGLFTFHPWAPGAAFWLDKGTTLYNTLANYMRDVLLPERLRRGEDAAHLQQGAVGDVRALVALPRRTCSSSSRKARQMSDEGDELPRALPALRERGAQLSRPADPLSRADAAAPQRSVRRAVGPDARPPVLAGRCALLRHAGADRRRSRAAARAGAARLRRLRAAVHGEAVDPARRSSSARSRPGITPRRSCKAALERAGRGLHAQRRRRRVLRAEDRLRRHRRDRPEVAVRDDSARLPACRSAST